MASAAAGLLSSFSWEQFVEVSRQAEGFGVRVSLLHHERRNIIGKQKEAPGAAAAHLQEGMRQLYANVEHNLGLAEHAETREWKEAAAVH